jgi:hypothetical protein
MEKSERIKLLFTTLNTTTPVFTIPDAIDMVETVLNQIENQYSGLPYNILNWGKGERMYVPPTNLAIAWKIGDDFRRANLSGNYFYFHSDGSMACANWNTAIVKWAKAGSSSFDAPGVGVEHPDKMTW